MPNERKLDFNLFKEPQEKFIRHLSIENNERIIFSGKFGHGKTTFLQEFFKDESQLKNINGKKYNVISLFPVNYSIASNEDIFRYIKYDIILEMLRNGYQIENSIETYYDTLPIFIRKNFDKVLAAIVYMVPHVGKNIVECYEKWDKLKNEYLKFDKDSKLLNDSGDQFVNFIEKLEQTDGSIYEDDLISKLIEQVLKDKLENDGAKENVLIIDDLDRIDPEHIFRILNVFAAHFDRKNDLKSKNKFGFDKVIIVCDIENIRNIFKAKYGADTDFNGYIDKFYSYEVFEYSNRTAIENFAKAILFKRTKWSTNGTTLNTNDSLSFRENFFGKSRFFIDVLLILFDNKQIDLRNLLKWENLPIPHTGGIFLKDNIKHANIDEDNFPILLFLRLFCLIKGSPESFKYSIDNIKGQNLNDTTLREYIANLVYLNTIIDHNKGAKRGLYYLVMDEPVELIVDESGKYQIQGYNAQPLRFNNSHLFWLISKSIDFLKSQNLL